MNQKGQLLMPMLGLMILFAVFFGAYLRWCGTIYWQMRMDIAAEAVALSAARAQAGMLNTLGAAQTGGDAFVPKVSVLDNDVAPMQLSARQAFLIYLNSVHAFLDGYVPYVSLVAHTVATANRAEGIPLPSPKPQSRLIPRKVTFFYFYGIYPIPGYETFENVYYARSWRTDLPNPQPIHENAWAVAHRGIVGIASARLWLDVDASNRTANGGFPRLNGNFPENVGIQCLYPQFNARLVPTSTARALALTVLAKALPS